MLLLLFFVYTVSYCIVFAFGKIPRDTLGCGIFGYSSKNPVDALTLLRLQWLAAENQSRGDDSTGVYGNFLAKTTDKAEDFIHTAEFITAVEGSKTVIGHTRKATVGSKIQANAHPFEVVEGKGKDARWVVGTHNGQIFPYTLDKLSKKYDIEKPDVDSEFIYKLLAFNNFDYDKTFSELEGMMALAFIRPDYPDNLYLYRRDSRPLHVGFIDSTNMYYSSELSPLEKIGCTVTESLDADNLYVFKNGGLLEVSPVKKPLIHIRTLEQGITAFMANATATEKAVLGISGVDVKKGKTAKTNQHEIFNRTWETSTNVTTDGGRSNNFPISKSLSLLPQFTKNLGLYTDEKFLRPPSVGRFYDAGSNRSCYLFTQLNRADDMSPLPAWGIRLKYHPHVNYISTHNGLGLLEISEELCKKSKVEIELFNPLQPNVVYNTVIGRIQSGRILEVVLNIPFPDSEKETQKNICRLQSVGRNFGSSNPLQGYDGSNISFKEFADFVKSPKPILLALPPIGGRVVENLPKGSEDDGGTITVQADVISSTIGNNDGPRASAIREDSTSVLLEFEYNKQTDILGMDYYSTASNLDELELHSKRIKEHIEDTENNVHLRNDLVSLDAYIDYLVKYMESRLDAYKKAALSDDEIDETNRYATIG